MLLERGLSVTAIDPAALHFSLIQHKQLTYLKKNASDVSLANDQFDLLVCDMSWDSRQMGKLINGLLPALQPHGTAIITAKLMRKNAFQTVREIEAALAPNLQLIKAKQLFHNREELTLYFIKKPQLSDA